MIPPDIFLNRNISRFIPSSHIFSLAIEERSCSGGRGPLAIGIRRSFFGRGEGEIAYDLYFQNLFYFVAFAFPDPNALAALPRGTYAETRGAGLCFKTGRPGQELPVSPWRRHRRRPAFSVPPSLSPSLLLWGSVPAAASTAPQPGAGWDSPSGRAAGPGLGGKGALSALLRGGRGRTEAGGAGAARRTAESPPYPALHYSTHQAAAPPGPPPAVPAHDWLFPRRGGRSASSTGPRSCPSARGVEGRWQHGRGCGGVRRRRAEALRAAAAAPGPEQPGCAEPGPARPGAAQPGPEQPSSARSSPATLTPVRQSPARSGPR